MFNMHCAYLLRLWRFQADDPQRVTLIATADPNTRHHFATLMDCFAVLGKETATSNSLDEPLPAGATTEMTALVTAQGLTR